MRHALIRHPFALHAPLNRASNTSIGQQVGNNLRESLGVADAPEFEMLRKGGVFMQSDEVGRTKKCRMQYNEDLCWSLRKHRGQARRGEQHFNSFLVYLMLVLKYMLF